jgi:hypothetical protein
MSVEPERRPPSRLRVYRAEDAAIVAHPVQLLDGSVEAAQAYVDRVTRSAWWQRNCPPSWMGDDARDSLLVDETRPPQRIIVERRRGKSGGVAERDLFLYRGRWLPHIGLGTGEPVSGRPAIADPWVILHEVAHIMAASADSGERGHGREFARFCLLLVGRWLGRDAASALRVGYGAEGVKYRAR